MYSAIKLLLFAHFTIHCRYSSVPQWLVGEMPVVGDPPLLHMQYLSSHQGAWLLPRQVSKHDIAGVLLRCVGGLGEAGEGGEGGEGGGCVGGLGEGGEGGGCVGGRRVCGRPRRGWGGRRVCGREEGVWEA